MNKIILGVLAALALSATASTAGAQALGCQFQGDTMSRDGDHSGRLGAPDSCGAVRTGRSVAANDHYANPDEAYGEFHPARRQ